MRYCENCGSELSPDVKFCEACGAPVSANMNIDQASVVHEHDSDVIESAFQDKGNDTVANNISANKEKNSSYFQENSQDTEKEKIPIDSLKKESDPLQNHEIYESKKSTKKQKKLVIPMLILLSILIVGGFGYIGYHSFFKNGQNAKEALETSESSITAVASDTSEAALSSESSSSIAETTDTSTTSDVVLDSEVVKKMDERFIKNISPQNGIYVSSIETNEVYARNADTKIRSASVIKLFLLNQMYEEDIAGNLDLNDTYILKDSDKVGGTGVMQGMDDGTALTYREIMQFMIVDSDNTAGNIIITRLGGPDEITARLMNDGYEHTTLERYFLDSEALQNGQDNYTSAADVGKVLTHLYQDGVGDDYYNVEISSMLQQTTNHTKITKNILDKVTVYEKTGEYDDYGVQNDAVVLEKDGESLVIVVLSQDGNQENQLNGMSQFGEDLYQTVWGDSK